MKDKQKAKHLKFFGIGKILPYLKKVRKPIFIMVTFGLLGSVADIIIPQYQRYALDLGAELGIPVQEAVRTGGSTNGAPIHLSNQGVPAIVVRENGARVVPSDDLNQRDIPDALYNRLTELEARLREVEKRD